MLRDFPPLTKLIDDGITKEIAKEFEEYNSRKGDRYPLSPSGIGKCALKLARDVAHHHGIASYPRNAESRAPKLQRVFNRGHLLESALIDDMEKYTHLKFKQRQQRVHLFDVQSELNGQRLSQAVEGDIDGLAVCDISGAKILVDFKSKGAFYSAGFSDSISEFFGNLLQTGFVEDLGNNCYMIKDVYGLFQLLPLDDFFVDYLLQLNSYAFSDWFRRTGVDGVALYYENKNTCANYEVRWVPSEQLFEFAKNKLQYVFNTTLKDGPEAVPRDFSQGSVRCRLCDYNELCNGKEEVKPSVRVVGRVDEAMEKSYQLGIVERKRGDKVASEILLEMERKGLTHITMSDGITYERKFLKSPKPHYELRLVK